MCTPSWSSTQRIPLCSRDALLSFNCNLQEARGPQVSVTLLFTPKEKRKKERKKIEKKIHNFVGWSFSRVFEKLCLPLAFILKLLAAKKKNRQFFLCIIWTLYLTVKAIFLTHVKLIILAV